MTSGQSSYTTLDQLVRRARHLLISFDGPIRSASTGNPPVPYIDEVLTACRESGRSVALVSAAPVAEVLAHINAHDLSAQITIVAPSIGRAVSALEVPPADCLAITSSPGDIRAARAAGVPVIAYAQTPDFADHLLRAGATAFVYSMMDLALKLRSIHQGP
jgi:beta-phosphoglucomutase-like phosphatase (HAD superfamily)